MTGDERAARLLVEEKEVFRGLEAEATAAHFERLREGRIGTWKPARCIWTRCGT